VPVSSLSKTPDAASLRRLVLMVGAVVLLDTAFFAVVAPLLPTFSHQFHLTKLGAGILEASYPAGMLLASIPGGMLSVRLGPRRTVVIGLVMLACTTIAFGFAASAAELDLSHVPSKVQPAPALGRAESPGWLRPRRLIAGVPRWGPLSAPRSSVRWGARARGRCRGDRTLAAVFDPRPGRACAR
jgi:MFS family permease